MSSPQVNNTQEPSQHQLEHLSDNIDAVEVPQPPPPLSPLAILVSRSRSFMTGRSTSFLVGGDVESSITSPKEIDNGEDNRTVDSRASQDYDDVEQQQQQQQGEEIDITATSPTKGSKNIVPAGTNNNKNNGRCKLMIVLGLLVVTICLGVGLGVGLTKAGRTASNQTAADTATSSSTSSSSNGTSQDSSQDVSPKFFPTNATSWPELVGMDGEEAKATLEEAYPGKYDIYIIPENSPVTMDLRWDRVRIFVDPVTGIVVTVPWVA